MVQPHSAATGILLDSPDTDELSASSSNSSTAETGDKACPFNFFYWDFQARHREQLTSPGRMSFILANLDCISAEEMQKISKTGEDWQAQIGTK